jgi:transcriptional regulator with XRE-family HTH domain
MRLRNNIFAAAFDYLKREKGIKTQKRLAELMGVSEDTITRILKDRTEVTEDIINKLQTASGCIFNLQWLRGEESSPMLADDVVEEKPQLDQSSLINAALAAKDETIAALREQIAAKDELIAVLRQQLDIFQQLRHSADDKELFKDYPFPRGIADNKDKPSAHV